MRPAYRKLETAIVLLCGAASVGSCWNSYEATYPVYAATVIVAPATASITVNGSKQLFATPKDSRGASLAGRAVSWTSSNDAVASVSVNGLVTGAAVGLATITATCEGVAGSAAVSVTAR